MPMDINNFTLPPYMSPYLSGVQRVYFIIAMVSAIIIFIANCLIYEDNDAKCWYLIIPFYNLYTKFKIFWNKNYFYVHLISFIVAFISILAAGVVILSVALTFYNNMGYGVASQIAPTMAVIIAVGTVIWFICTMIIGILEILLEYHVSSRYGYDGLFIVGLLLLPLIFYAILGGKCINSGVFRKIPTGRKVFMIICVLLLVAIMVLPIYFRVI